jgi:hypothetical protein
MRLITARAGGQDNAKTTLYLKKNKNLKKEIVW